MNYGLYLSAAGALSNMHRQDVFANNLANLSTVGFKPDRVDLRERLPERLEHPHPDADPQWMLERLGGGHDLQPTRIDLRQGGLVQTGRPLDLALEGDGFFTVEGGKLTRDGRFTIAADGRLRTVAAGLAVLDADGRPIDLDTARPVRIDDHGMIAQDDEEVARLGVVTVRAEDLRKSGDNLLRFTDDARRPRSAFAGRVVQGHTETSAVDPILTLNDMMNAAKAAQASLRMMQYHDHTLGQAFNTFGRVA